MRLAVPFPAGQLTRAPAVNYRLKPDDIAYILDHAGVEAVLVDAALAPLLDAYRAAHASVPVVVDADNDPATGDPAGAYEDAVREGQRFDAAQGARGWAGLATAPADETDVIALAYTSGTTARPKGVELTHRGAYLAALANVVEAGLNAAPAGGAARYLWTLPMFHAAGWTFPWAVTAARGAHYCLRAVDYPAIWRTLVAEKITHLCAAPTVLTLLCAAKEARRLDAPVRATVAASPPPASLFRRMQALRLEPVHAYGLTETYGPITRAYDLPGWAALPADERHARRARQGHGFLTSLPVRVVRRDAPAGAVEDVARDGREIGEIVCVGNICARGYYKDPAATRRLFAGGVLHTGDLAVWHADGSVQILDRAKDIIISGTPRSPFPPFPGRPETQAIVLTVDAGGENISSVALEALLSTHPAVLEAAVVAVPDARWGERPKAFVTAREDQGGTEGGQGQGQALTGEAVLDWARHQSAISRFMVPREIEVVAALPKTSTGKLRKNVLREWAKGGAREEP